METVILNEQAQVWNRRAASISIRNAQEGVHRKVSHEHKQKIIYAVFSFLPPFDTRIFGFTGEVKQSNADDYRFLKQLQLGMCSPASATFHPKDPFASEIINPFKEPQHFFWGSSDAKYLTKDKQDNKKT